MVALLLQVHSHLMTGTVRLRGQAYHRNGFYLITNVFNIIIG
jgi:hypothetical protein